MTNLHSTMTTNHSRGSITSNAQWRNTRNWTLPLWYVVILVLCSSKITGAWFLRSPRTPESPLESLSETSENVSKIEIVERARVKW